MVAFVAAGVQAMMDQDQTWVSPEGNAGHLMAEEMVAEGVVEEAYMVSGRAEVTAEMVPDEEMSMDWSCCHIREDLRGIVVQG